MEKESIRIRNSIKCWISMLCVMVLLCNCVIPICAEEIPLVTDVLYVTLKDDGTYKVSRYDASRREGKEAAIYIRQNANSDSDTTMRPVTEIAEGLCNNTGAITAKNTAAYVFHYMDIKASQGLVIGNNAFRRNMVGAVNGAELEPYVKIYGDTIARIGQEAFYGSYFYSSFMVEAPITWIDQRAFATAQFYKKPAIFNGAIGTIATEAFYQTTFNKGCLLYGGCKTIEKDAFKEAAITADNQDAASEQYGTALLLTGVEDIQAGAFSGTRIQDGSVVLSGDITKIGASAFEGMEFVYRTEEAQESQIPLGFVLCDSLSEIGDLAFAATGVTATNITMPDNLKHIGANAFKGWDALTSVTLDSNLTTMEKGALPDNEGMKLYLPDDLSDISGLNLASYAKAVIVVNETATHLQEQLQKAGCQYEIKKTQEESTTQAESSTQQENSTTQAESSTQIVVGDSTSASVLKKGDTFVVGNLKYKVISAKNAAFIGLKNKKIKHLMIPEQVKVGAQTFTITQIQKKACYHNKTLKMIVVGDCVVTMKEAAFAGCTKLKRIYLGTSIKTIGKKAFAKDKKIKKIVIKGKKLKSIGKNAFLDIPKSIDIRVPKSKIEAYEKMINRK